MKNWLEKAFMENPDKTAVIFEDQTVNYRELRQNSVKMMLLLKKNGVTRRSHVGIHLESSLEYIYCIYALIYMNCVVVPINTRLTRNKIVNQLQHADVMFLISNQDFSFHGITKISIEGEAQGQPLINSEIEEQALQCIIFTSGTTGNPKGVTLTYKNHYASAITSGKRLGVAPEDKWINSINLYHVGGMEIVFRSCIYQTCFILLPSFSTSGVQDAIIQGGTMISLVPTMLDRLLQKNIDLSSLRYILIGGAHADLSLIYRARNKGYKLAITYGMTEGCSQITTAMDEDLDDHPGTVGRPLDGISISIIPLTTAFGNILVKGDTISKGYYNSPQLNKEHYIDNHLRTGDLGYLVDGYLYVLQRRADLIVTGGENVLAAEIAGELKQHPSVKEVFIFGREDQQWGQKVEAAVLLSNEVSKEELQKFLQDKLASYKIPKEFYKVDSIPILSTGKIDRQSLIKKCKKDCLIF